MHPLPQILTSVVSVARHKTCCPYRPVALLPSSAGTLLLALHARRAVEPPCPWYTCYALSDELKATEHSRGRITTSNSCRSRRSCRTMAAPRAATSPPTSGEPTSTPTCWSCRRCVEAGVPGHLLLALEHLHSALSNLDRAGCHGLLQTLRLDKVDVRKPFAFVDFHLLYAPKSLQRFFDERLGNALGGIGVFEESLLARRIGDWARRCRFGRVCSWCGGRFRLGRGLLFCGGWRGSGSGRLRGLIAR
jgi:hypothetical protein